jgi:acyl dehydratase
MPIDPGKVGLEGEPFERAWTPKDCMLYALGVGCGTSDLRFATEKDQQVLPTMAVVLGSGGAPYQQAGTWKRGAIVHGEESIEVFGAIPPEGRVRVSGRIAGIYDRGKGALLVLESSSRDAKTDELRFRVRMSLFVRGEGGFGGERGPTLEANAPPDRKPDHELSFATRDDQALLYRLNGDMNPLHSDPDFARRAGFDRPILHGLCTYGFAGRALLAALCGGDPARFRGMEGRFSKPVFPGEALRTAIWELGSGEALFQTRNDAGDVVLDQGRCRFA